MRFEVTYKDTQGRTFSEFMDAWTIRTVTLRAKAKAEASNLTLVSVKEKR